MKRFVYFASMLAVLAACSKEVTPIDEPTSNTYTLLAEIAQNTRSTIDDETGAMTWSPNDAISVLSTDGKNAQFVLSGDQPTSMGTFTGTFDGTPSFAVYPYNEGNIALDDEMVIELPAAYDYDGESTHAPMLAEIKTTNEVTTGTATFEHVAGLIKVTYENVPSAAKKFTFTATKEITGTFTVEGSMISAGETGEENNVVTYEFAEVSKTMSFYVPAPCGTYGFSIALLDEGGNKIAKSGRKVGSATIEKGSYYVAPTVILEEEETMLSLTNAEIEGFFKLSTGGQGYKDVAIPSASGNWVGNMHSASTINYVQIRNKSGAYIASPMFNRDVKYIVVHTNASTNSNRSFITVPVDTELPVDEYSIDNFPNLFGVSEKTTGGEESLTIVFNTAAKAFKLICLGGATYINSIDVHFTDLPPVAVTGIAIDKTSCELTVGESETLVASVVPDNASNKNIEWSSSNESIAVVTNGKVSAKAAGEAIITATAVDGGFSATCRVKVNAYKPFEWTGGGKSGLTSLTGVTAYGLGSDYADGNAPYLVKLDNTGDYIIINVNYEISNIQLKVKMVGGSTTSSIQIQESVDGKEFTDHSNMPITGSQNSIVDFTSSSEFDSNSRYVKLVFNKGSNVGLGYIKISGK